MATRFMQRTEPTRAASWCARSSEERRAHIRRSLHGWIGLAVLISSGQAVGAVAPSLLPPESNYRVKWYQSDGLQPVANWDLEVTPVQNKSARFVAGAQLIPELSCWAVNVPVGSSASVRIRSSSGTQVSSWTPATSVPRPGGSYLVKWYQPPITTAPVNWDLEITPASNPSAPYVVSAQVTPQLSCWALNAPAAAPSFVRIRPVSGTQVSPWSAFTVVPEPGFAFSSAVAFGWLSSLARRRRSASVGTRRRRFVEREAARLAIKDASVPEPGSR